VLIKNFFWRGVETFAVVLKFCQGAEN
jgi:hypothetical protein